MKISLETVEKVAHLSRLKVIPGEAERLVEEMNEILNWMQKLDELPTHGIEPLIHISEEINQLREDVAVKQMSVKEALLNVPVKDSDYIRVPKVIE